MTLAEFRETVEFHENHDTIVEVHDVSRAYTLGEVQVPVLDGVSFNIHRGEFVVLYGPSGSGKTTLLNMLAGIDRPDFGTVHVKGHDLHGMPDAALTAYRRRFVGYVFQFYNLIPTLTALENVALALELDGQPTDHKAHKALAAVGLKGKEDRFPSQMSGGEQQRVAIARAFVKRPGILAADEPTGNLDATTSQTIVDLLRSLNDETGLTIILATHNPAFTAIADRVFEIRDGGVHERRPDATGPDLEA